MQKKLEEAAEKAALSNTAKYEADEARRLAEEAKSQAKCAAQPSCFRLPAPVQYRRLPASVP